MTKSEINEARTNPDFIKYLYSREQEAFSSKRIDILYEVLDAYLILDLKEDKVNELYEMILKVSFEKIEVYMEQSKQLKLENEELFYIRSLYEHAIEKWSYEDFQGSKALFFILIHIVDDPLLIESLKAHFIVCSLQKSLDYFYEHYLHSDSHGDDETYGYFLMHYQINLSLFIKENETILQEGYHALKHLLA